MVNELSFMCAFSESDNSFLSYNIKWLKYFDLVTLTLTFNCSINRLITINAHKMIICDKK